MEYILESPPEEISNKPIATTNLASEFNWMNVNGEDWTTPAKNQGPCGSCWAFGAVSCLEASINIAWNDPNLDIDLSEQYILSCLSRAGGCNGGNSYSAFKYIQSNDSSGNYCNGIITEDCLSYEADDSVPCSSKSSNWKQQLVPIANYGYWRPHYPEDVNAIKTELMTRGPLVTYFEATGSFSQWGGTHHSSTDYYPYEQATGANHAVIIVGYKDDPSIDNGGYWIVKNSWGTSWGYNGFFNIEYGSLNIDNVEITWVEYEPKPTVDFSYSPNGPMDNEQIQFTDLSNSIKGEIISRKWDFGDGTTSTEQNPVKTYDKIGIYTLTLTVTNSLGYENTISKKMYIGDDAAPLSSITLYGVQGENNWYINHVGIQIEAYDTFSGVNKIFYRIDEGIQQEYVRSIILPAQYNQGEHVISYYAVDNAGNIEDEKTSSFKIDFSDPHISISKPQQGKLYFFNVPFFSKSDETIVIGPLIPSLDIYDEVSGIDTVEFFLNNRLIDTDYKPPYNCIINRISFGKECSFLIKVTDNAGRISWSEPIYFTQYSLGIFRSIF